MLTDLKKALDEIKLKITAIAQHMDIAFLKTKQKEIGEKTSASDLWNDSSRAQQLLQELKAVNDRISRIESIEKDYNDLEKLIDLLTNENDPDMEKQLKDELDRLSSDVEKLEISTMLAGEHDASNAILSINAGAGGTDAQDWAEILMRMYLRWSESKGYEADLADVSYGEQAGIKSAVLFIKAPYAFGYLKSENGIHRLVRMSPFNADGKRHTSFAAVEVLPEIGEELAVEIRPEDLRIDTFRSSGPGGQNVQKVETAVRITHIPTGIVAACQTDKSQHRNKVLAMKLLTARLKDRLDQEHKEKIDELRGEHKQIAWGSQIRSYVFAPYQLVKDHRTNAETGNVQKVINGDIDLFIESYLKNMNR